MKRITLRESTLKTDTARSARAGNYCYEKRVMALACKICILQKGIRGSDIPNLPQTEEELMDHMEKVHHNPVQREGETHEECIKRFIEKYPEAKTCPECIAAGAEWTR